MRVGAGKPPTACWSSFRAAGKRRPMHWTHHRLPTKCHPSSRAAPSLRAGMWLRKRPGCRPSPLAWAVKRRNASVTTMSFPRMRQVPTIWYNQDSRLLSRRANRVRKGDSTAQQSAYNAEVRLPIRASNNFPHTRTLQFSPNALLPSSPRTPSAKRPPIVAPYDSPPDASVKITRTASLVMATAFSFSPNNRENWAISSGRRPYAHCFQSVQFLSEIPSTSRGRPSILGPRDANVSYPIHKPAHFRCHRVCVFFQGRVVVRRSQFRPYLQVQNNSLKPPFQTPRRYPRLSAVTQFRRAALRQSHAPPTLATRLEVQARRPKPPIWP